MDLPAWLPFATVAVLTLLGAAGGWLLGLLLAGANHSAGGET
jgi:uncharacterized protein (DUF983 family)